MIGSEEPICSDKSGKDFIQCIEGTSYAVEDVIEWIGSADHDEDEEHDYYVHDLAEVTPFITKHWYFLIKILLSP